MKVKSKMLTFLAASCAAAAFAAQEAPVQVRDYSWLQLPGNVARYGSTTVSPDTYEATYNGHSDVQSAILGDAQPWIPANALTLFGTNDYWVALDMGSPRGVERVRGVVWVSEGTAARRVRIEGSSDGSSYSEIGVHDLGGWSYSSFAFESDVADGSYRFVRLRFNGTGTRPDDPDYMANPANWSRGGPGVHLVEPYGSGEVDFEEVNVANASVFGAIASCGPGIEFQWNGFNNGVIEDGDRAGEQAPWDPGRYLQLDLGETRRVYKAILVADDSWRPSSAEFAVSGDGVEFIPVAPDSPPSSRGHSVGGTLEYTFHPVEARYWRITSMEGGSYMLLNQWMLFQTETHAPVVAATNATVLVDFSGMATPTMADVDAGSWDADGDLLSAFFTPAHFHYADVGTTQLVAYSVTDGRYTVATNIEIAIDLDPALGSMVPVADYSWLQLPQGVSHGVGSTLTAQPLNQWGWTSHGPEDSFRWGSRCWIPSAALTGGGSEDYWAAIFLDPPREVHAVNLEFWCDGSRALRRFKVEGSTNGVDFAMIGSHDFGEPATGDDVVLSLDVAPGVYSAVRVVMQGENSRPGDPDYTCAGGYGGPGLWTLEPIGNGVVAQHLVNFAEASNFGTAATHITDRAGATVNSGSLVDRSLMVGEDYPWDEGRYVQIDLGEARSVYRTIICMTREYGMTSASFAWSSDGAEFHPLEGLQEPVRHSEFNGVCGAIEYSFPPVKARFWRIVGADGGYYALFNQWMLYATDNKAPEVRVRPSYVFTVGADGATLLPSDVDLGTSDPDGDPLELSVSPSTFGFRDVGSTVDVTFSAFDGQVASTATIAVSVRADPALGGRIPVAGYNWLQLPDDEVEVAGCLLDDDLQTMRPLGSGYGAPGYMRWGFHVWIPWGEADGTGFGASNYVGVATFATPRNVSLVKVQMWTGEGAVLYRYHIDGLVDGGEWTELLCHENPDPREGLRPVAVHEIPSATYRALRVRLMAGDYSSDRATRGGPGIYMIQAYGSGAVEPCQINWANSLNFDSALSSRGMDLAGGDNLSGDFAWGDDGRIGTIARGFASYSENPDSYGYVQVDLGARRWVRSVVVLWNYLGDGPHTILASDDGTEFAPVQLEADVTAYDRRMTEHAFSEQVKARFIRLADIDGYWEGHALINQILVMGGAPRLGSMLMLK